MPLTRAAVRRAHFAVNPATAFDLRGSHGPWRANPVSILKTAASAASALGSMAYGAYKGYKGLSKARASRRRSRGTMRGGRRSRRRAPRTLGKYRGGSRYTTNSARKFRKLNTNVRRNDYRTIRVQKTIGEIEVGGDSSLVQNNFRYACHLDHWTTDWAREIEAYDEFKLANIQFVLEPRFTSMNTASAKTLQVPQGEIPYLALRNVIPANLPDGHYDAAEIRRTPGFRFIKIGQKSRVIVNSKPTIRIVETYQDNGATLQAQTKMRSMPWVKVVTATKALDVAAIEIRKPVFEAASIDTARVYKYDVKVYATLKLRGNQDELIQPY